MVANFCSFERSGIAIKNSCMNIILVLILMCSAMDYSQDTLKNLPELSLPLLNKKMVCS